MLHPTGQVRLTYGPRPQTAALGGAKGPTDPLRLVDGRFLRMSVSLFLDEADERGALLKVRESSFQYQVDTEGKQWVFRYDYLREPGSDPHPTAHLQIRGRADEPEVLPEKMSLDRVHFPTGRISLEAVIRLLIEQFRLQPRTPPEVWRPVLAESERSFREIAHQPLSGPES